MRPSAAATDTAADRLMDRVDSVVFDLDGTVYLGEDLLPGAGRLIEALRASGRRTLFCSNNPTRTAGYYAAKLGRLGVDTPENDVYTSLVATVRWVVTHMPDAKVFPIGEQPLWDALREAGVAVTEDAAEIDLVISSYDRQFDYRKLQIAFDALWMHRRARLVATNPDRYCPFPGGRGEPDAASVTAAITASTGVVCEAVFGKPERDLFEIIAADTGIDPARTVMIGDRMGTDIRFAQTTGMISALVLTGETTPELLAQVPPAERPDIVLDRIDQLLELPDLSEGSS